jgi:hypothetical protein
MRLVVLGFLGAGIAALAFSDTAGFSAPQRAP